MGHYRTYERRQLGDLFVFANNLMSGMAIQPAYFLTDPDQNTAAISAECKPWYRTMGGYLENLSYMVRDTWTEPMDDIESRWGWGRRFFWYVRWVQQDGSVGTHRTIRRGSSGEGIDAAYVELQDEALQEFIKSDMIAVRAEGYTVPSGEYPIIRVEEIDEAYARSILEKNVSLFSGAQISEDQITDSEYMYSAHIDSQLYWVGKASGAYTFSETDKIMAVPCEIKSAEDAVEIALAYVAEMQLVDLQDDETLDVVFVSQVMNAAVDDGEKEPFLSYPSDYFVSFGRRYKEIPVINSSVTVRIGEEGKLMGVQKNWRRISGESGTVAVDESVVEELMVEHLLKHGIIEDDEGMESIEIVNMYCGYIEGYTSNEQDRMGLGCIVNYRHSGSEMISQVVFPVAEIDFPLCGIETIEPVEYEEPIDDEEEPEDEPEESGTSHLLTAVLVVAGIFVVNRRGNC